MLLGFFSRHIRHHGRFYIALILGAIAFFVAQHKNFSVPEAAAGDVFFLSYIVASWWQIFRLTHKDLAARAASEDEGAVVVVAITLAAILFTCAGIFQALNRAASADPLSLVVSLAGAPLGWMMLHTLMTFHYANLYYACENQALDFPGTAKPGPWDFVYFSYVVGMTAQTSDVAVKNSLMRRTVTFHGIMSFLFNTVLIALAVNISVSAAR